ncbi:MAG: hypothetical protein ACO2PN_23970 [Pyrobaculum sp.]
MRIAGRAVRRRKKADVRVSRGGKQVEDQGYAVYKWAAEMEREFIREHAREALARLKAQGKPSAGRRSGRRPRGGAS